jgi:hypothetical protein
LGEVPAKGELAEVDGFEELAPPKIAKINSSSPPPDPEFPNPQLNDKLSKTNLVHVTISLRWNSLEIMDLTFFITHNFL